MRVPGPSAGRDRRRAATPAGLRAGSGRGLVSLATAACAATAGWRLRRPRVRAAQHPPDRGEIASPSAARRCATGSCCALIAVDRAFHFVVLVLLGVGVLAVRRPRGNPPRRLLQRSSPTSSAASAADRFRPLATSESCTSSTGCSRCAPGRCARSAPALLGYGLLEGIEAVGLWYTKRWAEYLTFIATAVAASARDLRDRSTGLGAEGHRLPRSTSRWSSTCCTPSGCSGCGAAAAGR